MSRDRFTIRGPMGDALLPETGVYFRKWVNPELPDKYLVGKSIDRLAEYEDLIFSPDTLNAIIKEWEKWADAKNDGRLLILPCKEGEPVYQLNGPCVQTFGTCPYEGGYGTYRCGSPERCKPYIEEMEFSVTMMPHFGRIYFKTKEEAKKSLEERYGKT